MPAIRRRVPGLIALLALLASACVLSMARSAAVASDLHQVHRVFVDVRLPGGRTPISVQVWQRRQSLLAEALVRRGFLIVDDSDTADATVRAFFDRIVQVDDPGPGPPFYSFLFELLPRGTGVAWESEFEFTSRWADSQAEEHAVSKAIDQLFTAWKASAVRAGDLTAAQARKLQRVVAQTSMGQPGSIEAAGYLFPRTTDLGCPNESCLPGRWLVCAAVDVRERPGSARPLVGQLTRGERFDVFLGVLLTIQPGEVRVTREIRQRKGADQRVYKVGETLHVLGHLTEGFFATIHNGRPVTTELFWRWDKAGGFPIAADVIRESVSERWLYGTADKREGWIKETDALVSPQGRTEPLTCPGSQEP